MDKAGDNHEQTVVRARQNARGGRQIVVGDNVWIGGRAIILKGVIIGDGAVVAAGAVVTRNVPPRTIVAGVPARVIRENVSWRP